MSTENKPSRNEEEYFAKLEAERIERKRAEQSKLNESAEKMPSSVSVGSRPRMPRMRSCSPGVRLCSFTTSGVTGRSPGKGEALVRGAETVPDLVNVVRSRKRASG